MGVELGTVGVFTTSCYGGRACVRYLDVTVRFCFPSCGCVVVCCDVFCYVVCYAADSCIEKCAVR